MNCMNCGAFLTDRDLDYCPNCGYNVLIQKKVDYLSKVFYNQGLEKASIRDLSGAIACLKQSLMYDKRNIQARNLLGLVYFETGEVVSALSEWVISKNLQPTRNQASEYINKLQANPCTELKADQGISSSGTYPDQKRRMEPCAKNPQKSCQNR